MTEAVRPADLPSDAEIDKALDLMLEEYNGALPMFIEGIQNKDMFIVLISAEFFAELLGKIILVNDAIPHIEDEAVAEKARNAVTRFEEILQELEATVSPEQDAIQASSSEDTNNDSHHGVFVIDI